MTQAIATEKSAMGITKTSTISIHYYMMILYFCFRHATLKEDPYYLCSHSDFQLLASRPANTSGVPFFGKGQKTTKKQQLKQKPQLPNSVQF